MMHDAIYMRCDGTNTRINEMVPIPWVPARFYNIYTCLVKITPQHKTLTTTYKIFTYKSDPA
jgi:hypothetical protein